MLTMFFTAYVLGIVVAMPPGSVTIEAARRAITFGFRPAFIFNLGSTSADLLYALVVYAGLAPLLGSSDVFKLALWIIGGGWLIWLGWGAFNTQLETSQFAQAAEPEASHHSYMKGVGVTLLNPLTIFAWISLAGSFFANWHEDWPPLGTFGLLAVLLMLAGVMTWMVGLMSLLSTIRRFIDPRAVRVFSMGAGLFLMLYGVRAWWSAAQMLLH